MFAGVIDKSKGAPWGSTGLTTAGWRKLPLTWVALADLIATQPGVLLALLLEDLPRREGSDEYVHVISHDGRLYLEDGHHRAMQAMLRGNVHIWARVFQA